MAECRLKRRASDGDETSQFYLVDREAITARKPWRRHGRAICSTPLRSVHTDVGSLSSHAEANNADWSPLRPSHATAMRHALCNAWLRN